MNIQEEEKYKQRLEDSQKVRANNLNPVQNDTADHIAIPPEDQPFIDDIL